MSPAGLSAPTSSARPYHRAAGWGAAIVLLAAAGRLAALGPPATAPARAPAAPALRKQRGVSWVAGGPVTERDFQPLVKRHVDRIVQTPFGWQRGLDSPHIALATAGRVMWGETDAGLRTTAALAREHGIRTLLKPHIWVGRQWRGEIRMKTAEDWSRWFEDYRTFILHYARLAEQAGIDALCIGTELRITAREHEAEWRRIIAEVRAVYHGPLTYAANWYAEFEEIRFWDALDLIGVQGYFPLSEEPGASLARLRKGWQPHVDAIERVQCRAGKPVLFTELGYRSTRDAAVHPWEWPGAPHAAPLDLEAQSRCYEAFFETFWDKPWFAGVYWWKWFPRHAGAGGTGHPGFTPQNKPAEEIIGRWFARPAG